MTKQEFALWRYFARRIEAARSLAELHAGLCDFEAFLAENEWPYKLEELVWTHALPTFGGEPPLDTTGIYSWDPHFILTYAGPHYEQPWRIESR